MSATYKESFQESKKSLTTSLVLVLHDIHKALCRTGQAIEGVNGAFKFSPSIHLTLFSNSYRAMKIRVETPLDNSSNGDNTTGKHTIVGSWQHGQNLTTWSKANNVVINSTTWLRADNAVVNLTTWSKVDNVVEDSTTWSEIDYRMAITIVDNH